MSKIKRFFVLILIQILIVAAVYPVGMLLKGHVGISINQSESIKGKIFLVLKGNKRIIKDDLVVFEVAGDLYFNNKKLLKRVVGVEGDLVIRSGNKYYINDELVAIAKDYSQSGERLNKYLVDEITIKKEEYFVIGDHKDSYDSRYFGLLPSSQIKGKAIRLWGER